MENAVAIYDDNEKMIAELNAERNVQYCSFKPKNEDDEILLFNVMNNPKSVSYTHLDVYKRQI